MSRYVDFFRERILGIKQNPYHPLVWILGEPIIANNVYIGGFSEINATGSTIIIEEGCDIASFVSINVADSHRRTIEASEVIERKPIHIHERVFIGSHSVIKGGAIIGKNSVVAAGTVVDGVNIPANSLVFGNPMKIKAGYYAEKK